jgi:diguanylate cyclase (GGDEF)-like protein/PAS domain S-box-containing protein
MTTPFPDYSVNHAQLESETRAEPKRCGCGEGTATLEVLIHYLPIPACLSCWIDGNVVLLNEACQEQLALGLEAIAPLTVSHLFGSSPQGNVLLETLAYSGSVRDFEVALQCSDDRLEWVSVSAEPLMTETGHYILWTLYPITTYRDTQAEFAQRAQQQAVVAQLGQKALMGLHPAALMDEAVQQIAQTLNVPLCAVFEVVGNAFAVVLKAGVGWNQGLVGQTTLNMEPQTYAGYVLRQPEAVIIEDLRVDPRMHGAPLLHNHRVVSSVNVVIPGESRPFGILSAHSREIRSFSENDVHFLQAIANIFATALNRKRAEDRLRLMERAIAASSNGIIITDPNLFDNPTIYINPAFEQITGYTAADILGKNCRFLQGPDTCPETVAKMRAAIRHHREVHVTLKNYRKDGTPFWNELNIAPVFDEEGNLVNFIGIQNNITEKCLAEEALKQERDLLNRILKTSIAAIAVLDATGNVIFMNGHAEQILGKSARCLVQCSPLETATDASAYTLTDWEGVPLVETDLAFHRVMQTGKSQFDVPLVLVPKTGLPRYLSINAAPLRNAAGQTTSVVLSISDITERLQMAAALRESEQRLNEILNSLEDVVWSALPVTGEYTYLNTTIESIYGYAREDFLKNPLLWLEAVHPEDRERVASVSQRLLATGRKDLEYRIMRPSGDSRWIRDRAHVIYDAQRNPVRIDGISTDITQRRLAEEALRKSEEQFRLTFALAPIGMAIATPEGQFLQVNQALCDALGYTTSELLDLTFEAITHPDDHGQDRELFANLQSGDLPYIQVEKRYLAKNGRVVYTIHQMVLVRDSVGQPLHIIGQIVDITQRRRMEERLQHDALHDVLTGLPNRALFLDRLAQAIARGQRDPERRFAVLFLDLDRFKVINDSLGHAMGDQLLVAIAQRLQDCLRPGDTVARLGGDEFTVLLDNLVSQSDATAIADRIHQVFQLPFYLSGYEIFTSVSIGITFNAPTTSQPDDLLRNADTAMYRAKAQGSAGHAIFTSTMHEQAMAQLQLENDLRRALERQEMDVYYQPIVSLQTGRLCGFEALVRWHHPQRGMISPVEFIPIAEETGLIVPIGLWVLEQACHQLHQWHQQFPAHADLTVAVNISARQFSQTDLPLQIDRILQAAQLPPTRLKLEITESSIMENAESAAALLAELKAHQISIGIDDFGTGYSSLSRLHAFPIDTLKIDRSFVQRSVSEKDGTQIIQAMLTLAHTLGMQVVAEGVETLEQLTYLQSVTCDYGQGYFFSQPLKAADIQTLLAHPFHSPGHPLKTQSEGQVL